MRDRPRTRRWLLALALGFLVTLSLGGGAVLLLDRSPDDVSNPDVPFSTATPPEAEEPRAVSRSTRRAAFEWPIYGYTKARTRYLPLAEPLRPPFAERWKLSGSILLEFPPVMGGKSLYLLKNNAALYKLARKSGKPLWKRKLGYLAASSPAYADGVVYVTVLEGRKGTKRGRILAIDAKTSKTKWSKALPSRTESSPLLHRDGVFFGAEDGTVYELRARDGLVRWRYKAAGAVKGALALSGGKLFFGDYGGRIHAIDERTGRKIWVKSTRGGAFGLGAGNFYATPAVAYGRVYIGGTDGFVYSFATKDGQLAWRRKTGGFVYSSPAVAGVGGRPTVYIGSYDKNLYALDARSGRVRWKRRSPGRISGGPTVLGDLVFFSTLNGTTSAYGARTGQTVWRTERGKFNAVVSNGRGIFLVGETNLFGLDGRPPRGDVRSAQRKRARARAVGRRVAERRRAVARRVAARRAAVRRRNDLRRSGVRVCFSADGRKVCQRPAPLVCFKRGDGRTVCRARLRR